MNFSSSSAYSFGKTLKGKLDFILEFIYHNFIKYFTINRKIGKNRQSRAWIIPTWNSKKNSSSMEVYNYFYKK
jgi:hypothetical protein